MKVMIAYPPLESKKGIPLLSQNRQFQWFHNPTYIYPMIPAMAATILKKYGFEVIWADGIAEKWNYQYFLSQVLKEKPDLIAIETKTPVVKKHWQIIEELKILAGESWSLKVVLMGDHVTALPEESMQNSKTDYVLTGGDFDLLLLNLCQHLTKNDKLESGIWFRQKSEIKNSGPFLLHHNLNDLPFIDRELTKWKLYAYDNGNYKKTPGTYIMAGRDCWWGKCTFCSWTTIFPKFRIRSPESVLDEIGTLIKKYKVKEIMDDTGTLPAGIWLEKFCQGMIDRGYNKKINFNCNMRFGVLNKKPYFLMSKAGFRFILYGLESANQKTADRLNKGIEVKDIEEELKTAKEANQEAGGHLEPHVTCMLGYPWETKEEAEETINMTKNLFDKGLIDSLQATIVIPYPGTPLFKECLKNRWLKTENWDDYDMSKPVMKTPMTDLEVTELTRGLYKTFMTPRFILRKILSIKNGDDLKFLWRAGKAVLGHLTDFNRGRKN